MFTLAGGTPTLHPEVQKQAAFGIIKYGDQNTGTQDFLKRLQPTAIFRGFLIQICECVGPLLR
jgi:hypothetical protein